MPMTNPPIGTLLDKVDCRYTLVVEVSKRARQLVNGMQPLIDVREAKAVCVAVEEVHRGLIAYERPYHLEED
jgi:DNA-directed RNA polymerase subunit omega